MEPLRAIAHALAGEVVGLQVLCPGPGHSADDRSLSVRPTGGGRFLVHSFAGDDWKHCKAHVEARCPPLANVRQGLAATTSGHSRAGSEHERIARAGHLWACARSANSTPAEGY